MTPPSAVVTSWQRLWFSRTILVRALCFAVGIGTLLGLLNHGYAIWQSEMTVGRWASLGLTYLVPYAVSSASAVMQARAMQRRLLEAAA
jgi:hypothetical protein